MKAINLEFQPQGAWRRRWMLLLFVLALMIFGAAALDFRTLRQQETGLEQSLRGAAKVQAPGRSVSASQPRRAGEVQAANLVIHSLNVPWGQLIASFEADKPNQVALLAIEPDVNKRTVRITGEAKALDNLPDYIDLLARQSLLHDVVLIEHQVQLQDPQKPIRFVLLASWGGRQERPVSNGR